MYICIDNKLFIYLCFSLIKENLMHTKTHQNISKYIHTYMHVHTTYVHTYNVNKFQFLIKGRATTDNLKQTKICPSSLIWILFGISPKICFYKVYILPFACVLVKVIIKRRNVNRNSLLFTMRFQENFLLCFNWGNSWIIGFVNCQVEFCH